MARRLLAARWPRIAARLGQVSRVDERGGRGSPDVERPEPVEVSLIGGRPARFVWRGRMHTVLSVLERPADPAGRWPCWRVTAAPGRNVPAVGYLLCQDVAEGRWLLSRDG